MAFRPTEEESAQLAALKAQIAERKPIDDLSPGERALLKHVLREMVFVESQARRRLGSAESLIVPRNRSAEKDAWRMTTSEENTDGVDEFVKACRSLGEQFEKMTEMLKAHRARWAAIKASSPKPTIKPEDRTPGDTWKVRVGAQVFDSIVDKHGVHRFRPNNVICDLWEAAMHGQRLDMNAIIVRMHNGQYTVEDVRELDALIGYSHQGFLELSYNSYPEENGLAGIEPVDIEEI